MAGSPRELKITYGSYTISGDSQNALLQGGYEKTGGETTDVFSFVAVIVASGESDFASKVAAFELAFSTPRALLKIELGSATLHSYDPSANTGFNSAPAFTMTPKPVNNNRSREYAVTVAVDKPTTLSGQNGRRNAHVRISYENTDKIHVLFTGEYTASGSNSARAQFDAYFETYATAFLTALTGTFERRAKDLDQDDANKVVKYSVEYCEILTDQGATRDVSAIVNHSLALAAAIEAPGDASKDVVRLTDVTATYSCEVVKTTTDLASLWEEQLKFFVIDRAKAAYNPKSLCIEASQVVYDVEASRLAASLRFKMAIGSTNVIESEITETIADSGGNVVTEPHDGQDFSGYVDKAPAIRLKTTTERMRVLGGASPSKTLGTGGWVFVSGVSTASPKSLGTKDGPAMAQTEWTRSVTVRYVVPPKSGGGGGIGSGLPGGIVGGFGPGPGGTVEGIGRVA